MSLQYEIAFWNLENLFDVDGSPRRSDKLQRALGKDIDGWTDTLLNQKIGQLASIILQMKGGSGPDILGVAEVENEYVMGLLAGSLGATGRTYAIVHHDSPDERGIDVAFIYDSQLFSVEAQFDHFVMRRTATRDLLQVNFLTRMGRRLVVIANHWPARSGGQLESAAYRAIAGETLSYFHERIWEVVGKDTPVIALGDFNDEPFDASITEHALGVRTKTKVLNATSARFLNLMWPLMGTGVGTLFYNNFPNMLDQFLVDKNMLKANAAIRVIAESVQVVRFPEMVDPGDYDKPVPFGGMGSPVNTSGFSDHFPISVTVIEKD